MKVKAAVFLAIAFLAFLAQVVYVYAQMGYKANMMNGMMNFNNKNYAGNNFTSASLSENAKKGQELFELLCAKCHGKYAQGLVGPDIQGSSASNINWALKNVSMMSGLSSNVQLKNQNNIRYISDFLKSIKNKAGNN